MANIGNDTIGQIQNTTDMDTLRRIYQFVSKGNQDDSNAEALRQISLKEQELNSGTASSQGRQALQNQAMSMRQNLGAIEDQRAAPIEESTRHDLYNQQQGINQQSSARGLLYSGINQGNQANAQSQAISNLANQRAGINRQTETDVGNLEQQAIAAGLSEQQRKQQFAEDQWKKNYEKQMTDYQNSKGALSGAGAAGGAAGGAAIGSYVGPVGTAIGGGLGAIGGAIFGNALAGSPDLPPLITPDIDPTTLAMIKSQQDRSINGQSGSNQNVVHHPAQTVDAGQGEMVTLPAFDTVESTPYTTGALKDEQDRLNTALRNTSQSGLAADVASQNEARAGALGMGNSPMSQAIQSRLGRNVASGQSTLSRTMRSKLPMIQAEEANRARSNNELVAGIQESRISGAQTKNINDEMLRNKAISDTLNTGFSIAGRTAGNIAGQQKTQSPTTNSQNNYQPMNSYDIENTMSPSYKQANSSNSSYMPNSSSNSPQPY